MENPSLIARRYLGDTEIILRSRVLGPLLNPTRTQLFPVSNPFFSNSVQGSCDTILDTVNLGIINTVKIFSFYANLTTKSLHAIQFGHAAKPY